MSGAPRMIGRYEVTRVLGQGAMGVVYLAYDPLLKRPLAIKTVRELGLDTQSSLIRFQREAEISARLSHPNVVAIHDVGQDPEAGPFLAMEYIDGLALSELIEQGLPAESAVHLLLQAMGALQAAERAGITHRDVKPSNILVTHDGQAKLMDFGIARGEGTRLTQAGQIVGTPSYTAPETLVGAEPSSASDRYAFAVTAFQMLTSELPFECSTIAATLYRIVHDPPLFPENMGPALRAVFGRALAKLPAERYPDLAGFMGDLIRALDLPPGPRAKFLATLAGDAGTRVGHMVRARAEATASFSRDLPTMATPVRLITDRLATRPFLAPEADAPPSAEPLPPAPAVSLPKTLEFPAPQAEFLDMAEAKPLGLVPLAPWPEASPAPPVPRRLAPVAPVPARRRWPVWAGLGLLLAAGLGAGVWWQENRYFMLDLSSAPDGARVFMAGREIGHTHLTGVRIPRKGATLRLELAGYAPQELQVSAESGPMHLILERSSYTVRVVSDPPGAEAFLNGVAQGRTPILGLEVPEEGTQELTLRRPGAQEWKRVLERDEALPDPIRLVAAQAVPGSVPPKAVPRPKPLAAPAVPAASSAPVAARAPVEKPAAERAPATHRAATPAPLHPAPTPTPATAPAVRSAPEDRTRR